MGVREQMVMAWLIGVLGPIIVQAAEKPQACWSTARYSVLSLPFTPRLITSSGVVAGITELRHAVVWHRDTGIEEPSLPEGFDLTEPVAVMPSGEIVIDALDAKGHKRGAFTYSKHHFAALAGRQTWARGVGAAGMIVGEWVAERGTMTDAVYWSNQVPHALGLCCGGVLKAVNQHGSMVGDAYDDRGHYHAFQWSAANGQRIIDSTDEYSSAVAINSAGHILLQVGSEGYLYRDGHLGHLDLTDKGYISVQAMNDCDEVVGGYGPVAEAYRAFVWSPTMGLLELNDSLPADSGWKLGIAAAINDRGEIVGSGKWHNEKRGFLLTPQR